MKWTININGSTHRLREDWCLGVTHCVTRTELRSFPGMASILGAPQEPFPSKLTTDPPLVLQYLRATEEQRSKWFDGVFQRCNELGSQFISAELWHAENRSGSVTVVEIKFYDNDMFPFINIAPPLGSRMHSFRE